ncbi:MAG TPA: integration host factor subunit alpha [Micropepsaceae bacterium]|nr:integration host factor subunit alpha [Micropepsaceae bacterium]
MTQLPPDYANPLTLTGNAAAPTVNERGRGESRVGGAMSGNGKTLTRADLTEAVFNVVGLSRNESSQMVEDILEEVCGALSRGETVKLSSFGTFQVRQKSQRVGRNPKTGDEVPIAPRRVLVFRPSHVLKAQINGQEVELSGED